MTNAWINRWHKNQTGWHQESGHSSIDDFWLPTSGDVLVPLCGKSFDMLKLANRGHQVTGVELSEQGVRQFFDEQELEYRVTRGRFTEYIACDSPIRLIVADFFDFDGTGFSAIFDRAALIALPPQSRSRYADHVGQRLAEDAFHLLVTIEYDQSLIDGPPFAVAQDEVRRLYPQLECIAHYSDLDNSPGKFAAAGVSELSESVWQSPN